VISGFGGRIHTEAMQRAHYDLVRWFVSGLYETTQIDWLFDWWQTLDAWVTELESAWPSERCPRDDGHERSAACDRARGR
jgi:hypothetical protein